MVCTEYNARSPAVFNELIVLSSELTVMKRRYFGDPVDCCTPWVHIFDRTGYWHPLRPTKLPAHTVHRACLIRSQEFTSYASEASLIHCLEKLGVVYHLEVFVMYFGDRLIVVV